MKKLNENRWKKPPPGNATRREEVTRLERPSTDTLRVYFSSIKRYSLLSPSEEKQLAGRIARGDPDARKTMIESNLRLVVNIAKRYVNRGFQFQDLIEEGNVGLIKSVERFRASKGCRFSTYATYWIRQSIERAMANQSNIVRLPIHVSADITKMSRATRELMALLKRDPTINELAEKTGLTGRHIKKLKTINRKSCPIDSVLPDGTVQSLLERLADDTQPSPMDLIDEARRIERVRGWLDMLDKSESGIIKLRFGLDGDAPRTLESIGGVFGVTRERVRQIEARALDKLKSIIKETDDVASFDAV